MARRRGRLLGMIAGVVVGAATISGIAWATIPDGNGVVHACYLVSNGQLRVIDTQTGQACRADEREIAWSQASPAAAAHGIRAFTASGTFTVPAGVTSVLVEAWGAGGGGGGGTDVFCGGGGGGGAGGFAKGFVSVAPGQALAAVVGTGGAAGTAGPAGSATAGGTGGDTGVGSSEVSLTLSGQGGAGGGAGGAGSPGSAGTGGAGNPNGGLVIPGASGAQGQCTDSGAGGEPTLGTRPRTVGSGGRGGAQVFFSGQQPDAGVGGEAGYLTVQW